MSQTSIPDAQEQVFPGVIASLTEPQDVQSFVSEEASAEIPFGVLVVQGAADDGALLPTGADNPVGVVSHSHRYAKDLELGSAGLKPGTSLGVLRKGYIFVLPEEAVAPGDPVRVRRVAGVGETLGRFRTTADTTDTAVLTGAEWRSSGSATECAILEIDMLGATLTLDT